MYTAIEQQRFCGRDFKSEEFLLIREIVDTCGGISRNELALTVCELLDWKSLGGKFKVRECQDLLELLDNKKVLKLPAKRKTGVKKNSKKRITVTQCKQPYSKLTGSVEEFAPLEVELIKTLEQRQLFKDLISRYHYLGYATPYGARLQYFIYVTRPGREVVGCVQFSSPAWRMKSRDQWIGWDDDTRGRNLQHIVNNSRFLVLSPIRNLASMILSSTLRCLKNDWLQQYGIAPLLVETLVDRKRFNGGCYKAANWIEVGETSGRGRMDRTHQRHGARVKTVLIYPLVKNAERQLIAGR